MSGSRRQWAGWRVLLIIFASVTALWTVFVVAASIANPAPDVVAVLVVFVLLPWLFAVLPAFLIWDSREAHWDNTHRELDDMRPPRVPWVEKINLPIWP